MSEIWTKSIREEIIGCLWLIAAFTGKPYIPTVFFWIMISLGAISYLHSIMNAYYEHKIKKLKKEGNQAAC
ncbi:MAG: hypothetical protein GY804_04665 [Alphaproteobacteria bacterium]|nr:hypothetical protein [Alphaproteobacteria bacterium]